MARKDPIVGLSVLKEFSKYGYFSGTVLSVQGQTYNIRYTDGECEKVARKQVIDLLMPEAPCVFASTKLSGDAKRVIPKWFLAKRSDLHVWAKVGAGGALVRCGVCTSPATCPLPNNAHVQMEEEGWKFDSPAEESKAAASGRNKKSQLWRVVPPRGSGSSVSALSST